MDILGSCNDVNIFGSFSECINDYDDNIDWERRQGMTLQNKTFYFVKHGVTDWSKEMIVLGPLDLPMNSLGHSQAENAAEIIKDNNITMILSSTLKRCVETTETILKKIPNVKVIYSKLLEERYFGDWSTIKDKAAEIVEKAPEGPRFFGVIKDEIEKILPNDAETQEEFKYRIITATNTFFNKYYNETILIVAHGCVRDTYVESLNAVEKNFDRKFYATPLNFTLSNYNSCYIKYINNLNANINYTNIKN